MVRVDGVELTLVDTAGLRDSTDPIEQEGMRRARAEAARADLILSVLGEDDAPACDEVPPGIDRMVIHNKIDLSGEAPRLQRIDGIEHLYLSARSGTGMNLLRERLAARLVPAAEGGFSARARHVEALQRAGR